MIFIDETRGHNGLEHIVSIPNVVRNMNVDKNDWCPCLVASRRPK